MQAIVCSSYGRPGRARAGRGREARPRRRSRPRQGARSLGQPSRLVRRRRAADRPPVDRPAETERRPDGHRLRRHRRGGRQGRHPLRPGDEVFGARSGAFAEYVTVRDAVVREAGEHHVRGGGGGPGGGDHRASGAPGQGQAPGRPASADQRRLGRRRHVRGADREGARSRGDRPCAARGTSSSCARSAPTTSSTTRARTSRAAGSGTT